MEAAGKVYDDVLEETGAEVADQDDSRETAKEADREAVIDAARDAYDNVFAETCADLGGTEAHDPGDAQADHQVNGKADDTADVEDDLDR
jgi:hypothetical protein